MVNTNSSNRGRFSCRAVTNQRQCQLSYANRQALETHLGLKHELPAVQAYLNENSDKHFCVRHKKIWTKGCSKCTSDGGFSATLTGDTSNARVPGPLSQGFVLPPPSLLASMVVPDTGALNAAFPSTPGRSIIDVDGSARMIHVARDLSQSDSNPQRTPTLENFNRIVSTSTVGPTLNSDGDVQIESFFLTTRNEVDTSSQISLDANGTLSCRFSSILWWG
jgi:hypothetical protein